MVMLSIGEVAARTGLRPSAIRFYESEGLLPRALRQGGKRVYDASIVERVAAIQLAKAAGLELAEIRIMMTAGASGPQRVWRELIKGKRAQLDREMQALALMKRVLANIAQCSCATLAGCGRKFERALRNYSVRTEQYRRVNKPTRRSTFTKHPYITRRSNTKT
jgi:MerR family redox-sensitive transcriptional activator SoxR